MKRSVLVVKLSAIGDVVLSTPVAAALRRRFPDVEITWMVGEVAAPLLENNPSIDEILRIDENIFWRKRIFSLVALFFKLRLKRFEEVYILHWSQWFHFFFWLLRIPTRIGFARDGHSFRLTRSLPYEEASQSAHDVAQYLSLTGESEPLRPSIFFTESELRDFPYLAQRNGMSQSGSWTAIAPGGGHNVKLFMPQKRWPAEYFRSLLKLLLAEPGETLFLILGDSSERQLLGDDDFSKSSRIRWLAGHLSLRETALFLKHCSLFIGNDSGLLHLAGALDVPSVSLFGPTSPDGKTPKWTPHTVLYTHEVCSPCYRYGQAPPCPYGLRCLYKISPESVLAAAHQLQEKAHHGS